ncbi:hypothetical protein GCM10011363_27530 [Marivita lacus]|uniref:Uncharacterized protein n=1 Tax=Marivita lacus TaxID=1323742 RepID=A0ABQ1KT98_9RHOB|nr:hypothetical protein GCM10011363_27530 [Marivita lacus]
MGRSWGIRLASFDPISGFCDSGGGDPDRNWRSNRESKPANEDKHSACSIHGELPAGSVGP